MSKIDSGVFLVFCCCFSSASPALLHRVGGGDASTLQQGPEYIPVPWPLLCALHRSAVAASGQKSETAASCCMLANSSNIIALVESTGVCSNNEKFTL